VAELLLTLEARRGTKEFVCSAASLVGTTAMSHQ
jgi:hypothetical protein